MMRERAAAAIAALLLCAIATPARAEATYDIHVPEVETDPDRVVRGIRETLRFNPDLSVNPNRGDLNTSLAIPLPPHLANLSSLRLTYSAHNRVNTGLGIGWSWNLPFILPNQAYDRRSEFQAVGPEYSGSLVETSEELDSSVRSRLLEIIGHVPGALQSGDFNIYRPEIDRNGTLFAYDWTHWIILDLNGAGWVLDEAGLPIARFDAHDNFLHLRWSGGLLTAVEPSSGEWKAELEYLPLLNDQAQFKIPTPQGWISPPAGIARVRLPGRALRFRYDDGALTAAWWELTGFPVFLARYERPEPPSPESAQNSLLPFEPKIPVRSSIDGHEQWIEPSPSEDFFELRLDLNSDGVTDLVRFDQKAYRERLKEAMEKAVSRITAKPDHAKWLPASDQLAPALDQVDGALGKGTVFLADPRDGRLIEQPGLKIDTEGLVQLHAIARGTYVTLVRGYDGSTITGRRYHPVVSTFATNGIFFVDLNGDGLRDLISCPMKPSNRARPHIIELPSSLPEKSTYFTVSATVIDALRQLGHPAALASEASDVSKLVAETPRVFLQEGTQRSEDGSLSEVRWTPLGQVGFRCHSESLFLDVNRDGRIDVVSGNQVYLSGLFPEQSLVQDIDRTELFEQGDADINLSRPDVTVADIDQDGRMEVYQAGAVYSDPIRGRMSIARTGRTEYVIPHSPVRLLTSVRAPFGGSMDIRYENHSGVWAVATQRIDPNSADAKNPQPVFERRFSYEGMLVDRRSGVFTGFVHTREVTLLADDAGTGIEWTPRERRTQFSADVGGAIVLSNRRPRLNGLPLQESIGEPGASPLFKRVIRWDVTPLGSGRLWLHQRETEERRFDTGSSSIGAHRRILRILGNWRQSPDGKRLFPMSERVDEWGNGLGELTGQPLVEARRMVETEKVWHPASARLLKSREAVSFGTAGSRHDRVFEYDTKGNPKRVCRDKRCSEFRFDAHGRKAWTRSEDGLERQFAYAGKSPLVSSIVSPDLTQWRRYARATGMLLGLANSAGAEWRWSWWDDGRLKSFELRRNGAPQFSKLAEIGYPSAFCDPSGLCEWVPRLEVAGVDSSAVQWLDGFGRVTETFTPVPGSQAIHRDGTAVYGPGEEVLARHLPTLNGGDGRLWKTTRLDALGETAERREQHTFFETDRIVYERAGGCVTQTLNGVYRTGECRSPLGNLLSQSIGAEEIELRTNADDDLLAIPTFGYEWELDGHGRIVGTQATQQGPGIAGWSRESVRHDDARRTAIDSDGFLTARDSSGRVVRFERPQTATDSGVTETREYRDGRLSRWRLTDSAGTALLDQTLEHTPFGAPASVTGSGPASSFGYDAFERQTSYEIEGVGRFEADFSEFSLVSLHPVLSEVNRLEQSLRISQLRYENGLLVRLRYFSPDRGVSRTSVYSSSGRLLWSERIEENRARQPIERVTVIGSTVLPKERFQYGQETYRLDGTPALAHRRDERGRVRELGAERLHWNGADLVAIGDWRFWHDSSATLRVACRSTQESDCARRTQPDLFVIGDQPVHLVRVDGRPVAVALGGTHYAIVTDALGSVRAMFSPDGKGLLWSRHYGTWGEKSVTFHPSEGSELRRLAEHLERLTVWSYAGLIELPGTPAPGGQPLYWSESRVYHPLLRQWLSVDPSLRRNPRALMSSAHDWPSIRYVDNRPMEFVDPTGHAYGPSSVHFGSKPLTESEKTFAVGLAVSAGVGVAAYVAAPAVAAGTAYVAAQGTEALIAIGGPAAIAKAAEWMSKNPFLTDLIQANVMEIVQSLVDPVGVPSHVFDPSAPGAVKEQALSLPSKLLIMGAKEAGDAIGMGHWDRMSSSADTPLPADSKDPWSLDSVDSTGEFEPDPNEVVEIEYSGEWD